MPSVSPANPDKRDPNCEAAAARRPPGWYLAYHRHVRPRLWLCPVTLYAVYLCGAVHLSWKASDDWCSEPRFQALVALTLGSAWTLLQVSRLAGRLYRKRSARIEHALDQAAEQGWATVFWCVLYALLVGCIVVDSLPDMQRIWSAMGVGAIVAICYIFSCERRKIAWNVVLSGILLQFVLGTVMIRSSVGHGVVTCLGTKLKAVINYSRVGAQFTFGHAATGVIGEATPRQPHVFAFHIMTMTVFFSFLMSLVAFYGCLRKAILSIATSLRWSTGVSPCDALCVATNIVAAQNDLPWILRGYVGDMTLSQLHTAMASGFGSLSAATFAALISYEVDVASLISACVMSAPAVLVTSKMLLPEIEHPDGAFEFLLRMKSRQEKNWLEASLYAIRNNVRVLALMCVNLLGIIAFLDLLNAALVQATETIGWHVVDVQWLVGLMLQPMALILGVPYSEYVLVAGIVGVKTYVDEMVAFMELSNYAQARLISSRSLTMVTFALAGFSNLGSLGIQLSAWSTWGQRRLEDLSAIGMRAVAAGALCDFMTACVAGALTPTSIPFETTMFNTTEFLDS